MQRFRSQKGFYLAGKLLIERLDPIRSVNLFDIQHRTLLERKLFQKLLGKQHSIAIANFANFGLHPLLITML